MKVEFSTLTCHIFDTPLRYRVIQYLIGKLSDMVKMGKDSLVVAAL